MNRSKQMEKVLDNVFPVERGRVKVGICPLCPNAIHMEDFRDELSRKEYKISGLCQKCQDEVFGK